MNVLLITGSRVLSTDPRAPALRRYLAKACMLADIVVCGDAEGPDLWAAQITQACGIRHSIWMCHGPGAGNVSGLGPRSWSGGEIKPNDPLARDRSMVDWWALQADEKGGRIACLAIEAQWSRTKGTAFTLERASKAGYFCSRLLLEKPDAR